MTAVLRAKKTAEKMDQSSAFSPVFVKMRV
jgi:hypothetical protein